LCKKKKKKKKILMCTGGMEEWSWQRDGEMWGIGEAKVGAKVCGLTRFAAFAGQSRDEPYCKQSV
jgi:hypothetical protein